MIYKDFSRKVFKQIAYKCGSKQSVRDIEFARFEFYKNPECQYARRIDDRAFIVGYFKKTKREFNIIGIGVAKQYQGTGLARLLMQNLIQDAKRAGCKKITTRTRDGVDFYKHFGGHCIKAAPVWSKTQIEKDSQDYLMEISIK